jgi:hypothetical protein
MKTRSTEPFFISLVLIPVIVLGLAAASACLADEIVVAIPVEDCTLSVEANTTWRTLRLRAHHPQGRYCRIDKATFLKILSKGFATSHRAWDGAPYTSLFIGRLIDYPWLSQFLAESAAADRAGWDLARGKPTGRAINAYVAKQLDRPEILQEIKDIFAHASYQVAGVSVEKVLVGSFAEVPGSNPTQRKGKVPFDAMAWFRLVKH